MRSAILAAWCAAVRPVLVALPLMAAGGAWAQDREDQPPPEPGDSGDPERENGAGSCPANYYFKSEPTYTTRWVPHRVLNAQRGDVMLLSGGSTENPVTPTLMDVGQVFWHVMMVSEGLTPDGHTTFSHTTLAPLGDKAYEFVGVKRIKPSYLARIEPGNVRGDTADVLIRGNDKHCLDSHQGIDCRHARRDLLYKPGAMLLKPSNATYRTKAQNAVDWMEALPSSRYGYSIGAYSRQEDAWNGTGGEATWQRLGSHCSSSVAHALNAGGISVPVFNYPAQLRASGIQVLHSEVLNAALTAGFSDLVGTLFAPLTLASATAIANQVANCFTRGGSCDEMFSNAWQNPGDGFATSPDNIIPTNYNNQYTRNVVFDNNHPDHPLSNTVHSMTVVAGNAEINWATFVTPTWAGGYHQTFQSGSIPKCCIMVDNVERCIDVPSTGGGGSNTD